MSQSVSPNVLQLTTSILTRQIRKSFAIFLVVIIASVAVLASISFLSKWGSSGSGDGQFFTPTGITVDASVMVTVPFSQGGGPAVDSGVREAAR